VNCFRSSIHFLIQPVIIVIAPWNNINVVNSTIIVTVIISSNPGFIVFHYDNQIQLCV